MHPLEDQMPFTRLRRNFVAATVAMSAAGAFACSERGEVTAPTDGASLARGGAQGPDLRAALAAKNKYTSQLLAKDGVVGTAVGLGHDGNAVVKVYLTRPGAASVAKSLDGVAVETQVTGEVRAVLPTAKPGGGSGAADPTKRFARPVPIGVSAGNLKDLVYLRTFCTTGTLGARLKGSDNKYYALSNNHVFAVENKAQLGDTIIQPGQADNGCRSTGADQIGTLANYVPLDFSRSRTNVVDAAAAEVSTSTVGNSTPANGYGTPSSSITTAALNMAVQKYGRTTVLTHGSVTGLDATIKVRYDKGNTATFVHQIVITGNNGSAFSDSGDSGSLIVTDNSTVSPVGLLFAGSTSTTIANPIGDVLQQLGQKLGTNLSIQ
jgi:hypothetical protein